MKKIVSVLLIFVLVLSVSACGNKESKYCGTWEVVAAEKDGAKFTINELESLGDESLSKLSIILKEGGKACILENANSAIVDWEITQTGLKIGVKECKVEDELISIENNNVILYLEKTSDSQEISGIENVASEEKNAGDTESTIEWKEFIKEYEEWVDEYIEITKKYKENPTDFSILSDYTDMMTELTDWTTKTTDMEDDLSASEAVEYSKELARIAAKLAKAAQ